MTKRKRRAVPSVIKRIRFPNSLEKGQDCILLYA